ncbi:MAG: IS110 family transposase [Candidatus Electrothrix sp. AX1]|nr:IS110 family transposase [Candidatus Electrothrix sp. AX1]
MHIIHPAAAGIDIGASEIYVAVSDDRSDNPVRCFDTFTEDLHKAAQWLKECGIESVAMESTGVYWIPVFQILERYGFDVILVNARHVKNVPGRKTDVQDCQWLQYLHTVGLLNGSFRPAQEICEVRSLLRHRDNLVKSVSSEVQRMQKSLTQMNLQIHNVISDITGVTGMKIIDSILAGERNPYKLAELRDPRIKADKETIAKSLTGDYRREHLFTLNQTVASYRHTLELIRQCDAEIESYLKEFEPRVEINEPSSPSSGGSRRKPKGNTPTFDVKGHMHRLLGTDLTEIDGVSDLTAHVFFAEVGPDLSKFKNVGHFCSWLGLCPNNKVSGGKILSSQTRPGSNRLAQALRLSANSLWNSKSSLGDYFRRMRSRHGSPKAITATAHKLARIIFHLVREQKAFDETVFAEQEKAHEARLRKRLAKQAKSLGLQLVPA